MKLYIITYGIKDFSHDYAEFYEVIKSNYPEWKHFVESGWLIKTEDTAAEICAKLLPKMANRDSIFIAEVGEDKEGLIAKSIWEWIKEAPNENKGSE